VQRREPAGEGRGRGPAGECAGFAWVMAFSVVGWTPGIKGQGAGFVRRSVSFVRSKEKKRRAEEGADHVSPRSRVKLPHDAHDAHWQRDVVAFVSETHSK